MSRTIEQALDDEDAAQTVNGTNDTNEAIAAFMEKRDPSSRGADRTPWPRRRAATGPGRPISVAAVNRLVASALWAGLLIVLVLPAASDARADEAPAPPDGGTTTTTIVASTPLLVIPEGCQEPPVASVVFVGRVIAKDSRVARFQIEQVRAGTTDGYALGNLIDVRYNSDVEYLNTDEQYLVGAAPQGVDVALTSKVRAAQPLLGGNAVVGLTEKSSECPRVEDPVRTFHVDGSAIETSMFKGLSAKKERIVAAFAEPVLTALAIILGLVLLRWLVTAIALAVRRAAEIDRATVARRE